MAVEITAVIECGIAEELYEVAVVQTALVVAGGVLEAEGNLFALIFFPVSLCMEPCVLQRVGGGAEAGYRVVLGRVVHLQSCQHITVSEVLRAVIGSLRRGHVG